MVESRSVLWRWVIRLAVTTLACLLALFGAAGRAEAHASLLGTDPAPASVLPDPPAQATLRFDEPVTLADNGVQLFDAAGQRLPTKAAARDAVVTVDLPAALSGTYVVAWRVVSADGHPVAGSFSFSVGHASPQVTPPTTRTATERTAVLPLAIAQSVFYAGLLLTSGLAMFCGFVLPAPPAGRRLRRRISPLMAWTAAAGAVGAVAGLPLIAIDQQGLTLDAVWSAVIWRTLPTTALAAASTALVGIGLCVAAVRSALPPERARWLAAVGVMLGTAGPSLSGHSRAVEPQWLMIAVDVLHVLAASVWLGGLVGLAITLRATVRAAQAMTILTRFSTVAAAVLAALVASGSILAWRIIGSWENLIGTSYGQLLLVKIAVAAVAAALAGWNRYVLLPRAHAPQNRPRAGKDEHADPARLNIARVVIAEAAVLAVVVAVTGALVDQSPRIETATAAPRATGVGTAKLGSDLVVFAQLVPARVGQSRLQVQIQDAAGEPVEPGRLPVVRLASDQVDLGEIRMSSEAAGTWAGPVVLPTPGQWRVQFSLRVSEFDNPVTTVELTIG